MINVTRTEFYAGSKEEVLPGFTDDFPYIASYSEIDKYKGRNVPWHWHKAMELFYIKSGALEYYTPKGKMVFPAGSGGMVNSNMLHMTRAQAGSKENAQLIHLFDPSLIAGEQGSRIEQKYITPITATPWVELIALYPEDKEQAKILEILKESFQLSEHDFGYELKLRELLSDIWIELFTLSRPLLERKGSYDRTNDKIKTMMIYIHEHFAEKITVAELAAAAFSSERECFRAFQGSLHMTPVEYIKSYRLQMACQMLAKSREPVTSVSHACGLGSSSYFGKVFREYIGCTPVEYRQKWQDSDI